MIKNTCLTYPLFLALLLVLLGTIFIGCDPAEPDPSFIYIHEAILNTDAETQGTSSHKITDAWVYINDNPIGVYELPALVPVLETGTVNVKVLAGIIVNGISDTRDVYPYYNSYEVNLDLVAYNTDTIQPVFGYNSIALFRYIYDFETSSGFEPKDEFTQQEFVDNPALVYEGQRSLFVDIDSSQPNFHVGTINMEPFDLASLREAYLELNYKCDAPFSINLRVLKDGNYIEDDILYINKKENWNKIYVKLSDAMKASQGQLFEIGFKAESLPNGLTEAKFYFDNVKFVYSYI